MVIVGSMQLETLLDVNVMILMGLIGYFFNSYSITCNTHCSWNGFRKTIESEYRTAMSLSAGDPTIFFSSVVSLLFFALIILTIALQIKKECKM